MKRMLKLALAGALLGSCIANAAVPNNDDPTTFLGPTAKGTYTSTFNDYTAFSVLGEAGFKNLRVGGTLAWELQTNQRIKVSAEYLAQELTYSFFSGNTNQWVDQGALGAAYQYDLAYAYHPVFNLSAYASHAPNKSLSAVTGTYTSNGVLQSFVDNRRIAGSNAAGISPGMSFEPWIGTRIGAELNYDNVRYDTRYESDENATGFGGTLRLNQVLTDSVELGLLAAVRQPFNNYQADLTWHHVPNMPNLALGLEGAYTVGKNELPNSYNVLVTVSYDLDKRGVSVANYKGDLKGEMPNDPLVSWAADPAVYMPQVLAITD